jgi:hypothetical protein
MRTTSQIDDLIAGEPLVPTLLIVEERLRRVVDSKKRELLMARAKERESVRLFERVVLKTEDLGCLVAPQLALDEILAGAGFANMDLLLPLGGHHLRCVHQVHDTLPSNRADGSGEAVLTRSLRSEREDVRARNIADVNGIPRRARQVGFLLRAVQNAPQRLD